MTIIQKLIEDERIESSDLLNYKECEFIACTICGSEDDVLNACERGNSFSGCTLETNVGRFNIDDVLSTSVERLVEYFNGYYE